MKKIIEKLNYEESDFKNSGFEKVTFLDIETTGLNSRYSFIYLIGVLICDFINPKYELIQYLAEDKNEESLILKTFIDDYDPDSIIITYNGDNFDIPFLKSRMKKHNIEFNFINTKDIYKDLLKNKTYLQLNNYKLKTVEQFLGIERNDKYSGLDCIQFYKDYTISKSEELLEKILNHNYFDLYYLPKILKIYDLLKNRKTLNFTHNGCEYEFIIDSVIPYENNVKVNGSYKPSLSIESNLYLNDTTVLLSRNGEFEINFFVNKALNEMDQVITFIDTSNFNLKEHNFTDMNDELKNIVVIYIEKDLLLNNLMLAIKKLLLSVLSTYSINN